MGKTPRIIALVLGFAMIAFSAVVAGIALTRHQNPIEILARPQLALAPPPELVFGKDHLLVLVVGLDYDYDNNDMESSKTSRSDVIKAINLDFTTHKAYVLSIPRDMDAVLPSGQEAKINQAQSEGGIRESRSVIARWLGIPGFDRYVVLRIDTMKDLIDALGGVDVPIMNSDALEQKGPNGPIDYDDSWGHLHVHLKPGVQHLSGDQAVGYARFRHDWCSDPCRIMRQDQVVKSIVSRLKNDKLNTLTHAAQLIGVVNHDIDTNFTTQEELSLASAFSNLSPSTIETAQVPYLDDKIIPIYGDVIIPDPQARAQLVHDMLLSPPHPIPSPDAAALAAIPASKVRIDVENGTGVPGAAHRVAKMLEKKGFVVNQISDAPANVQTTELHEHTTLSFAAEKVQAALGTLGTGAAIVDDTQPASSTMRQSDVTVVLGADLISALALPEATPL